MNKREGLKPILLSAGIGAAVLILAFSLLANAPPPPAKSRPVDFDTQIRPILEKRCQPCHFAGGKMYARMPFDEPQTIRILGEKMFTRIKDPKEQALLRAFLVQGFNRRSELDRKSPTLREVLQPAHESSQSPLPPYPRSSRILSKRPLHIPGHPPAGRPSRESMPH